MSTVMPASGIAASIPASGIQVPLARATSTTSAAIFARDGFLSLNTLTTAADIDVIRSLLDPLFERFESLGTQAVDLAGPRAAGVAPRSPEVNEAVKLEPRLRQTETYARCRELARRLLGVPVGYQFDHAIFKPPYNQTATAWHQDEAYSDGPIPLRSIHFWIPLQPVTIENGCMWFVPGSNRMGLLPHYAASKRTGGANSSTKGATLATNSFDDSTAVACPLEVGGATVHHPLTLHYTGPNQTNAYRKAWILHFGAYGWLRLRCHPKVVAAKLGFGKRARDA